MQKFAIIAVLAVLFAAQVFAEERYSAEYYEMLLARYYELLQSQNPEDIAEANQIMEIMYAHAQQSEAVEQMLSGRL